MEENTNVETPVEETPTAPVETLQATPEAQTQVEQNVPAVDPRIAEMEQAMADLRAQFEQTQATLAEREAAIAAHEAEKVQAADQAARAAAIKQAGLSEEFVARLQGATAEEYLADAKALAKLIAPHAPSTGATNPGANRGGEDNIESQMKAAWTKHRGNSNGFRL